MSASHWFLRFFLWFVAVVFCVLPVGLAVARDPASVAKLFDAVSYFGVARDIILCAIAVLSVGLIDAFDCIADKLHASPAQTNVIMWSCVLVLTIVLQLVVYSFWSASMSQNAAATTWPYLISAIVFSLIARVTMLS